MNTTKKDLWCLLLVAGLVFVLAAIAPGVWATPGQSPLRQTLPQGDVVATDENGVEKNEFSTNESVAINVRNGSFTPGSQVDIYVVVDNLWTIGKAITADVSGGVDTILVNANGAFGPPPPVVWPAPLTPGRYDVVFDANRNGLFDDGDGVDDAVLGTGFVVQAISIPVGGVARYANSFRLIAPWIRSAVLVAVVVAAVLVGLRRYGESRRNG
jgi:hypothetical protein